MDLVIKSIQELNFDIDIKKELEDIYHLDRNKNSQSNQLLKNRVEDILERMFKNPYGYMIPMDFINSEIGKLLFGIKLEIYRMDFYGVNECTIIAQKVRSLIVKEMRSGIVLCGQKIGGHYYVAEEALYRYLTMAGWHPFSEDEARERIRYFKELREKYTDINELKEVYEQRYRKNTK